MNVLLELRDLKERLDLAKVLKHYGVASPLNEKGSTFVRCPLKSHVRGGSDKSCQVSVGTKLWHCFLCNTGGDVMDLIFIMERGDVPQDDEGILNWLDHLIKSYDIQVNS